MTNVCILKGRLCREPELTTTSSGMSVQENKPSEQSKKVQTPQPDPWAELSDLADKDLPF